LRWVEDPDAQLRQALRWSDNLKKCSCWMCGNPRKYEGRSTVQERRQLLASLADL
jgi:hypothetical protein